MLHLSVNVKSYSGFIAEWDANLRAEGTFFSQFIVTHSENVVALRWKGSAVKKINNIVPIHGFSNGSKILYTLVWHPPPVTAGHRSLGAVNGKHNDNDNNLRPMKNIPLRIKTYHKLDSIEIPPLYIYLTKDETLQWGMQWECVWSKCSCGTFTLWRCTSLPLMWTFVELCAWWWRRWDSAAAYRDCVRSNICVTFRVTSDSVLALAGWLAWPAFDGRWSHRD